MFLTAKYATDITDILEKPFRRNSESVVLINYRINQSLHFKLMWNHDILELRRICTLQVRKLWRNLPFDGPNMKAWSLWNASHSNNSSKQNRKMRRNIFWFNPPFSQNVKTNIGKMFLKLIRKHFPRSLVIQNQWWL